MMETYSENNACCTHALSFLSEGSSVGFGIGRQSSTETQIEWVTNSDKHLQAVFKRDRLEYTLEAVFAWSAETRIAELAPSFYSLELRADYDPTNLVATAKFYEDLESTAAE